MPDLQPVQVACARLEATGVTSYDLVPVVGELPTWEPGAHIDVHLPSETIRQYSLCGDPDDRTRYRIAVLELPQGRGGSVEVHRELRPGVELLIATPRQDFGLVDAEHYVFVAGGIGITPILTMVREAQRRGTPWELVYGARSARHFAFADEVRALGADRVSFVDEELDGFPDLVQVVGRSGGAAVYCCGPPALMDALTDHMAAVGRAEDLHLERFAPPTRVGEIGDTFKVELARSDLVLTVGAEQTVLEAIRSAGVDQPSSCEMGICGTCETKVLAGEVDHRDDLLTESERAEGNTMMVCVSRAACSRLVLDL